MTDRPSRAQLRRHARRLRRDGFQPTMFVNPGDPLPETASAAIVRALWRYRSELAPIALAAITVAVAATLHRAHSGCWPWLVGATVMICTALAIPPPAWLRKAVAVLDQSAERVYAAVVVLIAGGWLAPATALGPATRPMPILAGALTVAGALPWWSSRRRRAKIRVDRMLESWPEIAKAVGLAGSQVMSAMVDVWGWRARFRPGTRADHP